MTDPQLVNRIAFRQAPAVGTVLMRDGQRYVVIDIWPYRRKDGTPTTLIVWRSHCSDCGQSFELTTPLATKWPNRRCPAHHAPGQAVTAAARQRSKRRFAKRAVRTAATHGSSPRVLVAEGGDER